MKHILNHLNIGLDEFQFQFQSHPDYPSALAFSDTLSFLGIKNDAYELDKEYWNELPEQYIALVNDSFSLVKRKENKFTVYSEKIEILTKEELYKNSGDFVLLIEKSENIKAKSFFNFKPIIYLVFGIIILYSFLQFTWYESVFNILSLIGVYISLELFNQKFGQESAVVSNICGGAANSSFQSSCSKIFSSDNTDILGLKLSDFSLIYFLGITFIGLFFPQAQFILRVIAMISILVILYSFYVQAFVEKSLCRVCMVIIFVLVAQIAISSFYFNMYATLAFVFIAAILFISLFFTVAFLNNLMNQKDELKKSYAKNLRFKRNYDLFKRELKNKEKIEFTDQKTFFLGNTEAKLHISVVSNPYCGFCKDAHKIVEDLLLQYPDEISAQMRFNYSGEKSDKKYTQLISYFLSIYKNKSRKEFLNSVNIWFKNRDESEIKRKCGDENPEDLNNVIQMTAENSSAGLTFTPVFIINGHQFPDKYDREDIHYFINELIEDESF